MSAYTDADVRRVMEALGCWLETDDLTNERYCPEHNAAWLSDIDACPRAERVLIEAAPAIAARALREAADEWGIGLVADDTWRGHTVAAELRARADEIERP